MADINSYIAQQAEALTDRILARLQNIPTPARRAQALRSILRKLRINDQVVAQVGGGVNLRRAMISGYGDYIRLHAGIGSGLGDDPKAGGGAAGSASAVLGIINQVVETAGAVGETVAGLWGAFGGGGGGGGSTPPPADPPKISSRAPGYDVARIMAQTTPYQDDSFRVGGLSLGNIPPMVLIGGAAAAAGLGYYLLTSKKKGPKK